MFNALSVSVHYKRTLHSKVSMFDMWHHMFSHVTVTDEAVTSLSQRSYNFRQSSTSVLQRDECKERF